MLIGRLELRHSSSYSRSVSGFDPWGWYLSLGPLSLYWWKG